jgi:RNA recognition motif-containing protein
MPFIFLEFATKSEAWKALKLSGSELGTSKITVKAPPGGLELLKSAQGLNLRDIRAQLSQKLAADSIGVGSGDAAPAPEVPVLGPKSVIADNMPKGTNAEAIRVTFGDCGVITGIVVKRGGRRATITFESHADAKKCAKRSGSLRIGDKRIRVILDTSAVDGDAGEENPVGLASNADASNSAVAHSSGTCIAQTVLVSGLHLDANEQDIRAVLQECGSIVAVRIQPRAKSRVAFVDFATKTAAKKATKMSGVLIRKQLVSIKPSRTTNKDRLLRAYADAFMEQPPVAVEAPKVKATDTSKCHTVIVKNIDYNADEDSIKKHFSKCGQIKEVRTFKEKDTGAFKGLTYIEFSEGGKPATKAVSCNGELFFGRPLKIDYAASAEDVLQARYEHFRALKKGGMRRATSKSGKEMNGAGIRKDGNRSHTKEMSHAGVQKRNK